MLLARIYATYSLLSSLCQRMRHGKVMRKAVVWIATRDEMLDRALFHRTLKATRFAQLLAVALRAAL